MESLTSSGSAGFNVPFAINIAFTRAAASAAAAIPHPPPATDVGVWLPPIDGWCSSATASGRMSHLLSDGLLSHLLSSGNSSHLLLVDRFSRFAGTTSAPWLSSAFSSPSGLLSHLLDRFLRRRHTIACDCSRDVKTKFFSQQIINLLKPVFYR